MKPERSSIPGCLGKVRYKTYGQARKFINMTLSGKGDAYRCFACNGYHLTRRKVRSR